MNYFIFMMNGDELMINEKQHEDIKNLEPDEKGLIYIKSIDKHINTHSVIEIMNEQDAELFRQRKRGNNKEGVLHDGVPVLKHFGNWYEKGDMIEENGRMIPARLIDKTYYPEVALDCVPSPEEYHAKFAQISTREERLKAICGKDYDVKRIQSGGLLKLNASEKLAKLENLKEN